MARITIEFNLDDDDGNYKKQELDRCLKADAAYSTLYNVREELLRVRSKHQAEDQNTRNEEMAYDPELERLIERILRMIDGSETHLDELWT